MVEPNNVRALVVGDKEVIRRLVKAMLTKRGYQVVGEATDGVTAIEMTEQLRPSIVIMDAQMPDMDGVTAARHIHDRCPTPVIILTALETREVVQPASTAGVSAYLLKQLSPEELERATIIAMARFTDMIELIERARELDAFAHTVAHDLKNPLGVLVGFAELLEEDFATMPKEDAARLLRSISENGRKAVSIVDELLLWASLRRGEVPIAKLDMSAIVDAVVRRLTGAIEKRHAQLILPDQWPAALGYGPWVEEIWVNYVDNAIKYGGCPPCVELGANVEPGGVRFWTRDNGPGLTAGEQAQLFTSFTRLDQLRVQGHGLGLSIARRIAEKLDGRVGVESRGIPGEGSLFYFVLPSASVPAPEDEGVGSRLMDFTTPLNPR